MYDSIVFTSCPLGIKNEMFNISSTFISGSTRKHTETFRNISKRNACKLRIYDETLMLCGKRYDTLVIVFGIYNKPTVGATVACTVAVEEAMK